MPLVDKIKSFISSPKGRQLIEKGRREASKPENQARIRKLMNKNKGR